mmetsp:Transcript_28370/g.60091  ORF Transcript_28370/g.60091 Transcript_28370/m.60091 type:complete len:241 (+) Transcript_28370:82-804(+)|eukprot:CAMPEP_0172553874 /NCGR_PEP_ID=MMETSP1067-20121228/52178_1 /TAXON_ID=265564 ORGANISM="Thalassiosira punctigera, Strain Tpunct2005C2" /NCGR_SAMPLE_ID=MMETSP1067 /ASSEMBLY_ACC=CAM_ASM_000444 /LENGTH=240 /DNA_ID=CAMNT_0013342133 /DNA_START=64 /DNA_END=786 /DNA_ORIENTATION=-
MAARRITIGLLVAVSTSGVAAFAPQPAARPITQLSAAADDENPSTAKQLANAASLSIIAASLLLAPLPSHADGQTKEFKLPPIDNSDKSRCVLNSSKMGQANAARDKLYDLRECKLDGVKGNEFDLSGVIMTKTDVSGASFREAQFSKGYLRNSNFDGADFTNAIVDRASFKGSSLKGTIFQNAVLTATSFEGADVENADFTDAYIGDFDIRNLCKNPTLKGENPTTGADTRLSAQCAPN